MSPALRDMATIAAMQRALKSVRDLDNATQRAAAYIIAGIDDADIIKFDAEAVRTERARRQSVCQEALV